MNWSGNGIETTDSFRVRVVVFTGISSNSVLKPLDGRKRGPL